METRTSFETVFVVSVSFSLFIHEFIFLQLFFSFRFQYDIDILHYIWLHSHQPTSRDPLNLSIFYSNDDFIVLVLCSSCVRVFLIFLCHSSLVQQLNTKNRLSQAELRILSRASEQVSMWRCETVLFAHNAE